MTTSLAETPRFHKQLLLVRNPVRFCNEVRDAFGDLVLVRGFRDFYLLADPEHVGAALLNKDGTFDRVGSGNPIYERIRNIGRTGLATASPEQWRPQRRRLAPLFTPAAINGFTETMMTTAGRWCERWDALARAGRPLNLKDEMNELSLEVNTQCLFATELREDHALLQGWFATIKEYLEAFPYPVLGEWWFPTPLNRRTRRARAGFDQWAFRLIAERRRGSLDPNARDMVTRMLLAKDPETGEGMTDEQICHEMLTFLIAGFESTSSALLWTFYELSQHPAVAARVHEEIEAVAPGRAPTVKDLSALAYTRRVIDEVMRKRPSAWFMARTTLTELELGGARIPAGSHLLISIPTVHTNPRVWPDPQRFDPDRFLPEAEAGRSPNAYIPFGRGAHACIGAHFSLLELLVMTAFLARRYRIELAHEGFDPDDVRAGLSVYPRDGLRARVVQRERLMTDGVRVHGA